MLYAPDHYNGFFYKEMPPFCLATEAHSVGDSRFELLMDALGKQSAEQHVADQGSLREDLLALVLDERSIFAPVPFAAFCGMFAEVVRDPEAAQVFMRTFVEEQPTTADIWDRARQRGEVGVDVDAHLFTTALFFGLVHVNLLEREPLAGRTVARVIDNRVLPGATAPAAPSSS